MSPRDALTPAELEAAGLPTPASPAVRARRGFFLGLGMGGLGVLALALGLALFAVAQIWGGIGAVAQLLIDAGWGH